MKPTAFAELLGNLFRVLGVSACVTVVSGPRTVVFVIQPAARQDAMRIIGKRAGMRTAIQTIATAAGAVAGGKNYLIRVEETRNDHH